MVSPRAHQHTTTEDRDHRVQQCCFLPAVTARGGTRQTVLATWTQLRLWSRRSSGAHEPSAAEPRASRVRQAHGVAIHTTRTGRAHTGTTLAVLANTTQHWSGRPARTEGPRRARHSRWRVAPASRTHELQHSTNKAITPRTASWAAPQSAHSAPTHSTHLAGQ